MNDPFEQAALHTWEWEGGASSEPDDEPTEADQPLYQKENDIGGALDQVAKHGLS